jgi:hypothetical protein
MFVRTSSQHILLAAKPTWISPTLESTAQQRLGTASLGDQRDCLESSLLEGRVVNCEEELTCTAASGPRRRQLGVDFPDTRIVLAAFT